MKSKDQNNNSPRNRRHFSAQEKVRLLRLHLVEGQPISSICEQHQLHPTLFYQWQKTFFENGAAAFESSSKRRPLEAEAQKIERLEAGLKSKDEVIEVAPKLRPQES